MTVWAKHADELNITRPINRAEYERLLKLIERITDSVDDLEHHPYIALLDLAITYANDWEDANEPLPDSSTPRMRSNSGWINNRFHKKTSSGPGSRINRPSRRFSKVNAQSAKRLPNDSGNTSGFQRSSFCNLNPRQPNAGWAGRKTRPPKSRRRPTASTPRASWFPRPRRPNWQSTPRRSV